jgi:hypothetical protein
VYIWLLISRALLSCNRMSLPGPWQCPQVLVWIPSGISNRILDSPRCGSASRLAHKLHYRSSGRLRKMSRPWHQIVFPDLRISQRACTPVHLVSRSAGDLLGPTQVRGRPSCTEISWNSHIYIECASEASLCRIIAPNDIWIQEPSFTMLNALMKPQSF